MSRSTRLAFELMDVASLRNGMYSANGTGCRLVYVAPGPVVGDQRMPTLRSCLGPGPSRMAPTRIGTPTACTARVISAAAVASVYGSTSEEFSGHTTRLGCGTVPAL